MRSITRVALRASSMQVSAVRPRAITRNAGSVSVVASSKPQLYYFPIRGRAEVMRMAFAAAEVDYEEIMVPDIASMKDNYSLYQFGQCPVLVDGDMTVAQSNTIIRYLARKYNMMGTSEKENVAIDMILEGIEAIRIPYAGLIYFTKMENKDDYFQTHIAKATGSERNRGAHFAHLADLVGKTKGKFAVGDSLSIADLALYDIIELHVRIWGDDFKNNWPELVSHKEAIAAVPAIKSYLGSAKQPQRVNGSPLG